ncbi:RNA polymerase sigma factor [Sphingomonas glacialis]|uniref:RNA polymerase sigma factor n=2 Tax=Sphingomonas glacialis TaxID=658225 RepID=A0A502FQR5_9SPHN|nr:RNA polymerase sigma factor [Sphingomonas glacialis]
MLRAQLPDACASDATMEALYVAEGPRLLRYFQRRTGNSHSAPDLVQDAFVRFASAEHVPNLVNPAAYLQRIARNLLIDRARRAQEREVFVPLEEWDAGTPPDQEDTLVVRDALRRYEEAIAALPERTRLVFLLKRADDLTYPQIAKRLGITLWTVQYHMKRALTHLDRTLNHDD